MKQRLYRTFWATVFVLYGVYKDFVDTLDREKNE
jgi:hypothetical protein